MSPRAYKKFLEESENPGQVLVMVGLMIMVLMAFAAIATDTGLIWMNRRTLQNAADAAALAGVQELPNNTSTAISKACEYGADLNDAPGQFGAQCSGKADVAVSTTNFANDTITVTVHKTVNPIFGRILGWNNIDVSADATAMIGGLAGICGAPLFQTQDLLQAGGVWGSSGLALNQPTVMKLGSSSGASGNFLALVTPLGTGANNWRSALGDPTHCLGEEDYVYSGTGETEPGNMSGPFNQGMNDRKAAWVAQGNCLSNFATDYLRSDGKLWKYPLGTDNNIELRPDTCYRMAFIPILDASLSAINGRKTFPIKGFALFYMSAWCNNNNCPASGAIPAMQKSELFGYYVGFTTVADTYVGYNGYGTKLFVLID